MIGAKVRVIWFMLTPWAGRWFEHLTLGLFLGTGSEEEAPVTRSPLFLTSETQGGYSCSAVFLPWSEYIIGKEKVASGSSWNRRAGTGSLTRFSSRARVEGCVEPQEPLLCGDKSSYDNCHCITSALPSISAPQRSISQGLMCQKCVLDLA